jgi:hypothetical protein
MTRDIIQARLPGFIGLVRREDVVRDKDGKIIAIRPRGHGNGSECEGTEGLSSAEKEPSGV